MITFEHFKLEEGTPIYQQILLYIKRGIIAGSIACGDELPSRRVMSALLGINPNTVQKAYHELEQRGIIYHSAGRGSFVAPTEELADAMAMQHLQTLEQEITAARRAGVSKQAVIELLEKLYKEAVDR